MLFILIIGKINLSLRFSNAVQLLFSQSASISDQEFFEKQLIGLPEPVQRYFNYTLKEGQPYISYARIKHVGRFKAALNKDWMNIAGEQYATTGNPGFIWEGKTAFFVARDMYIANQGRLIVSILSVLNIVDAKGKEQYDKAELLRWLGESILYPTNFLPSDRLEWLPIDAQTARLNFSYNGLSLFFVVSFNELGEITEMETKRFMTEDDLETWVIKASHYQELNNLKIPTVFDVLWRLEKGDFSYVNFIITEVEYDKPFKF